MRQCAQMNQGLRRGAGMLYIAFDVKCGVTVDVYL